MVGNKECSSEIVELSFVQRSLREKDRFRGKSVTTQNVLVAGEFLLLGSSFYSFENSLMLNLRSLEDLCR